MTLDELLIEWRKGYLHSLKKIIRHIEIIPGMADNATEAFSNLVALAERIILLAIMPLWFFPLTYWAYKKNYKIMKERYKENGIELDENYQPRKDGVDDYG
jgi:hypothetical protein